MKAGNDAAFRTRDLVALAAAGVAFFFATQSSPDSVLKLEWYIPLNSPETSRQGVAPLVADLDGDGRISCWELVKGIGSLTPEIRMDERQLEAMRLQKEREEREAAELAAAMEAEAAESRRRQEALASAAEAETAARAAARAREAAEAQAAARQAAAAAAGAAKAAAARRNATSACVLGSKP